jgi:hypothetical protein
MGQVTGIRGLLRRCLGHTLMRETQFMGEVAPSLSEPRSSGTSKPGNATRNNKAIAARS